VFLMTCFRLPPPRRQSSLAYLDFRLVCGPRCNEYLLPVMAKLPGQHSPRIGIRQIFEIAISGRGNLLFVIFSGGPTL
jgi:hypothetical protein